MTETQLPPKIFATVFQGQIRPTERQFMALIEVDVDDHVPQLHVLDATSLEDARKETEARHGTKLGWHRVKGGWRAELPWREAPSIGV